MKGNKYGLAVSGYLIKLLGRMTGIRSRPELEVEFQPRDGRQSVLANATTRAISLDRLGGWLFLVCHRHRKRVAGGSGEARRPRQEMTDGPVSR